eukprot:4205606-Pyramimonas_sp.AAC.1
MRQGSPLGDEVPLGAGECQGQGHHDGEDPHGCQQGRHADHVAGRAEIPEAAGVAPTSDTVPRVHAGVRGHAGGHHARW